MNVTSSAIGIAAIVGAASGADAAIWGMYKDSAHEGFFWRRFFRSILLGSASAIVIQLMLALNLPEAGPMLVLFGLAYAAERVLVEGWKTFVREEDQSKYTIPMQFSLKGVPVRSRTHRLAAGIATAIAIAGLAALVFAVFRGQNTWVFAGTAGLIAGLIIAVGGAWKDAPIEGFEFLKFWRSPALTVFFALMLFPLAGNALMAAIAAIGYERCASENYKTFFFPMRPRGKFAGKPGGYSGKPGGYGGKPGGYGSKPGGGYGGRSSGPGYAKPGYGGKSGGPGYAKPGGYGPPRDDDRGPPLRKCVPHQQSRSQGTHGETRYGDVRS